MNQEAEYKENPKKEESLVVDNRFLTLKEIDIYDSVELKKVIRTIPKNTLLQYDRKVIRNNKRLAQIKEGGARFSYFVYSDSVVSCEQCMVNEFGIDVLNIEPDRLSNVLNNIKFSISKKEFKDSKKRLPNSEVIAGSNKTILLLKDKKDKKNIILEVVLNGRAQDYKLRRLEPFTKFYIIEDYKLKKGKSIIFMNGERNVLFHDEGLYSTVDSDWQKFYKVLGIIVGLAILLGGIFGIAVNTGYVVVIGVVMVPVTLILTAILITPIIWLVEFLRRLF